MTLSLTFHDITSYKEKGEELVARINKEMKVLTKSTLYYPIPNIITMTQEQYDDLMQTSGLPNMYHSEDRMFQTPYNVMEVRVDKRKKLTFKEAHSLDDEAFNDWEKSVEGEDK